MKYLKFRLVCCGLALVMMPPLKWLKQHMSEEQTQTLSTFFPAIGNVLTIIFVGALLLIAWKRIRDFQVRGKSVLSPEDAVLRSVDLRTESTTKFS